MFLKERSTSKRLRLEIDFWRLGCCSRFVLGILSFVCVFDGLEGGRGGMARGRPPPGIEEDAACALLSKSIYLVRVLVRCGISVSSALHKNRI